MWVQRGQSQENPPKTDLKFKVKKTNEPDSLAKVYIKYEIIAKRKEIEEQKRLKEDQIRRSQEMFNSEENS